MSRRADGGLTRPASPRATIPADYRNPFRSAAVSPERIDQGVDYAGRSGDPIYALGPGRVVEVFNYGANSGWPDGSGAGTSGGWVSYRLTTGPLMGKIVYVAEGVQPAVRAGQQVDSSTVIGHFAGAGGIETGWAGPPSQGDQTLAYSDRQAHFAGGDIGGWSTEAGVTFSNLMAKLGAPPGIMQAGGVHGAGGQVVNVPVTQVNPGGGGTTGGTGGPGPDCLIGAPGVKLFIIAGPTVGGQCLFSRSQARAVIGGAMLLVGGGVFLVATLVLAAYGLKASGATDAAKSAAGTAGKIAGTATEAAGAVTGQPEVIAAGQQARKQGMGRTVSAGVQRQAREKQRRQRKESRQAQRPPREES